MRLSKNGVDFIKRFEGLRLQSYYCAANVLTIGYGHTGPDVFEGQLITEFEAERLLKKDLRKFEDGVNELINPELNQNQYDALVSFAFNVGVNALKTSTLRRRLNKKEDPFVVVQEELPRWNKGAGGQVLAGLARRRKEEVELFNKKPEVIKMSEPVVVTIKSKHRTVIKKEPIDSSQLPQDKKATVGPLREYKDCKVLERRANHTLVDLPWKQGQWWIFDPHWTGMYGPEKPSKKPATEGTLTFLPGFPFYDQKNNGPDGWRQCQSSSIAMCLNWFGIKPIYDDLDYLAIVNKYGDTVNRPPHYEALKELKVEAQFFTNLNATRIKDEIRKGKPVPVGILHHGPVSKPSGGGHFVVVTGFDDTNGFWLVQDPYGELNLVNGGWSKVGQNVGQNQRYSYRNTNPRLFVAGPNDGWGWIFNLNNP
jgi:lysozyme